MPPFVRALPLLALSLAACAPMAGGPMGPPAGDGMSGGGDGMPAPVLPSAADDTCGAARLASFIGQPASGIDPASFAGPIRVYRQGDPVTMDFNAERINFETDALGEVVRIRCG